MREEAWQGSPHVEAGLASVPDATRVPVSVAVPAILHPGPQVRGCGTLGAKRTLLLVSMRSAVFLGSGSAKNILVGESVRVCVCYRQRPRQKELT